MKTSTSFICAFVAIAISQVTALPVVESVEKRSGGSCDTSNTDFQTSVVVGTGGTAFCESNIGTTNQPITALTFWDVPNFVVGVQAAYADGTTSPVHGTQTRRQPKTISVDYAKGQSFHSTQLFASADGKFTRHVRMVTSNGHILNSGEAEPVIKDIPFQAQPVGNGTLLGFQGTTSANGDLESLGFIFA